MRALLVALLASGCAAGGSLTARPGDVEVLRLESKATSLRVPVALANDAARDAEVSAVEYELLLLGETVVVGSADSGTVVPAGGKAEVLLPIDVTHRSGLPRGLRARLKRASRIAVEVRGVVRLADGSTTPFATTFSAAPAPGAPPPRPRPAQPEASPRRPPPGRGRRGRGGRASGSARSR